MKTFALTIFLALLTVLPAAPAAEAPRSIQQVPLYPGSQPDAALLAQERQIFEEGVAGMEDLRAKAIQVVTITADADDVFRWYAGRLKAREDDGAGFDPAILMRGGTSPVVYSAGYYEKEDFENQYERDLLIRDGAWVKRSLQGRRRTADGRILRNARFIWEFMNRDGGRSELTLVIDDISFDFEKKTYALKTMITILFQEFDAGG
jgi:hypothetical protein